MGIALRFGGAIGLWAAMCLVTPSVAFSQPRYQPEAGVAGSLSIVGSDTLAELVVLWGEAFSARHPAINIQVQALGSSSAPPALTEETSSLGPMSRPMTPSEILSFEAKHGYPPTAVPVALDAVAVYVHRANPASQITLAQLDGIFSATRYCGGDAVSHWRDLSPDAPRPNRRIRRFGRNSGSGTHGFFRQRALCGGDFDAGVAELPGSSSVVHAVGSEITAVGYAGIGYATADVRALPVSAGPGQSAIAPRADAIADGSYPLARTLYIYVNQAPGSPVELAAREYLTYVLSTEGQSLATGHGYVAVPEALVAASLTRIKTGYHERRR